MTQKPPLSRPNPLLTTLRRRARPTSGQLRTHRCGFEWDEDRLRIEVPAEGVADLLFDASHLVVRLSRTEHVVGDRLGLSELFGSGSPSDHWLHVAIEWPKYTLRLRAQVPGEEIADLPIRSGFGDDVGSAALMGLLRQLSQLGAAMRVHQVADTGDSEIPGLRELGADAQREVCWLWKGLEGDPPEGGVFDRLEQIYLDNGLWRSLETLHERSPVDQGQRRLLKVMRGMTATYDEGLRLSDLWLRIGQLLEQAGDAERASTAYFLSFKSRGRGLNHDALAAKLELDRRAGDLASYRQKRQLQVSLRGIGIAHGMLFARLALEALRADRADKAAEALRTAAARSGTASQRRLMQKLVDRLAVDPDDVARRLARLTDEVLGLLDDGEAGESVSAESKAVEETPSYLQLVRSDDEGEDGG